MLFLFVGVVHVVCVVVQYVCVHVVVVVLDTT